MFPGPHTLHLKLRPSRGLALGLVAAHLAAIAVVWSSDLPLFWMLAAKLAVAASLAWTTWGAALRRAEHSVIALEIDADGRVRALQRDGEWVERRVGGETYVSPLLTILVLHRVEGRARRQAVAIPADSADEETLRQLRVWLRHRVPQPATGGLA